MTTAFKNRELSWLQFNERVLHQVSDPRHPVFERLRFLSIFHSNLDEFFMIRVGSLMEQSLIEPKLKDTKTQWTAHQQLEQIFQQVQALYRKSATHYRQIHTALSHHNIFHLEVDRLSRVEESLLEESFHKDISALLSIQIVDAKHPLPQFVNKQVYVVLELERKNRRELGIVTLNPLSIPPLLMMPLNKTLKFMPIEEVVYLFSHQLFKDWKVLSKGLIRLTRNADIDVDESDDFESEDFRTTMKSLLKKRLRLSPVRLEMRHTMSEVLVNDLRKALKLDKDALFELHAPLSYAYLSSLEEHLKKQSSPSLFYQKTLGQPSLMLEPKDSILKSILKQDLFFATPFHAFSPYLQFLSEASRDPKVFSIQITLYRVASESRILHSLIQAAEAGKEVTVLFELKARFDESNNIEWSSRLEEAGVRVVYGVNGYKVHSKVTLIKRKEGAKIQTFCHLATGNYNEKTATQYTDFHVLTAHPAIGKDVGQLFQHLLTNTVDIPHTYHHLWVAPHSLHLQLSSHIHQEIEHHRQHQDGHILLKLNALTDVDLMNDLILASQAGVKVELFIRGICCLIPGIKHLTENITVISTVGRYLEHARLYYFHHHGEATMMISSADGMTRNLHRRVEVACPILDESARKQILDIMDAYRQDTQNSYRQNEKGHYIPLVSTVNFNVHTHLMERLPPLGPHPEKSIEPSMLQWLFNVFQREI